MQTDATLLGSTCCVRLHGTTTMLAAVKHLGTCKRTQHCWSKTPNNSQERYDLLSPPFAWAFMFDSCLPTNNTVTLLHTNQHSLAC